MDGDRWRELWSRMPLADAVLEVWRFLCEPAQLEGIFAQARGRCYDREIAFPDLVQLIADALLEYGGSGNQSFSRGRETGALTASKVAAYGKLGRLPLAVSQEFLRTLTRSLGEIFPHAARRLPPASLRGFRTVILDGKAIKRVAKRLKALRKTGGGLLGGRALVALEWDTGLAIAMHTDEDGDANDVRFVPDLLPVVRRELPGVLLFLADSGFCDLERGMEFTAEGHHFLMRQHPKVGFHPDPQRPARTGVDAPGRTFVEEWGWLGAATHPKRRFVRRITLRRTGEPDVTLVTDLLDAERFPAAELLDHYLQRWGIEQAFQKVTEVFHLETLIGGTPKATLFQFAFCLLLHNLIQLVRGYIAVHQRREAESISLENVFLDVHRQLTAWSVLVEAGLPLADIPLAPNAAALTERLHVLLGDQWSDRWIKAVNKRRRPHQPRPHDRTHGSVFRILHTPLTPSTS